MEQSNSSARRIQNFPRRKFIGVALAALGAASAGAGFAQDYPSRPIRIVVPFSPGGGVDALVRAYAVKLAASLGQPVIVDNRPGANGMIAADNVARSAADGYSLLASGSWLQTGSFLYRSFAFSPERDFTPVALIAETPMQIIVRSEVPAKSMSELIAYAKVNPGKLSYGTPGAGHPFHLAVEMLSQVTHAKFVHVPFKGGGPAIQEFLAGRIDMLFFPVNPTLADMIKSGKARVLASATDERLRSLPDVPTFREAGITNFVTAANISIVGPAKLPQPIVSRLHAELVKASSTAEVLSAYEGQSLLKAIAPPEKLGAIVQNEMRTWGPLVKSLNLVLD